MYDERRSEECYALLKELRLLIRTAYSVVQSISCSPVSPASHPWVRIISSPFLFSSSSVLLVKGSAKLRA
jgi:hypothetical protein